MSTKRTHSTAPASQQGIALLTAMLMLICLLLLGFGIVNMTTTEEKVARNARDYDIAFAAAEAALRDAELHVSGTWHWPYTPIPPTRFNSACTNGLCDSTVIITPNPAPTIDQLDFFSGVAPGSNSVVLGAVTGSPAIAGIQTANQPRYMIEMTCPGVGSIAGVTCSGRSFRITAQARGRLADTRVMLQEIFFPQFLAN